MSDLTFGKIVNNSVTLFLGSWKIIPPGPVSIGSLAIICEIPPVCESIAEITGRLVLKYKAWTDPFRSAIFLEDRTPFREVSGVSVGV